MDLITIIRPIKQYSIIEGVETFEVDSLADVSDGYHNIVELYDHRTALFIALCKAEKLLQDQGWKHLFNDSIWRSKTHGDGNPAYEGWFIMGIGKEKGKQITYHLPLSRWEETDFAETLDRAPEWDKHTSKDVLERLKSL